MEIQPKKKMLLLRYNNYKNNDFIEAHNGVVDKNGYSWMLKIGKDITKFKLEQVMSDGGLLILKAPKSAGGLYYISTIIEYYFGENKKDMVFPGYYHDMVNDVNLWQMSGLEGSWLKVERIVPLPDGFEKNLTLVSNSKKVDEVVKRTRSSMLYVQSEIDYLIESR